MADKWSRVHDSFDRAHDDLFSSSGYTAEFFNVSQGTRSNLDDSYSGETRSSIGSIQVEIVPPAMDTTVRTEGTSFSWDTSIRFSLDQGELTVGDGESYTVASGASEYYDTVTVQSGGTLIIDGTLVTEVFTDNGTVTINGTLTVLQEQFQAALKPLGEDNEQPTEVEITDDSNNESDVYQLHGYSYEKGSGMLMCRLVEE